MVRKTPWYKILHLAEDLFILLVLLHLFLHQEFLLLLLPEAIRFKFLYGEIP